MLRRRWRCAPLVLAAVAGFTLATDRGAAVLASGLREASASGETRLSAVVTVAGIPREWDFEVSFRARVSAVGGDGGPPVVRCRTLDVRLPRSLLAAIAGGGDGWFPAPGDVLSGTGRLYLPEPQMNPYESDARRTLVQSGVAARCLLETAERLPPGPRDLVRYAPLRLAAWCYRRLQGLLDKDLGPAAAGLGRALLLGDKSGLTSEHRTAFERTGALHLLAVSGLHAGLFAGFVGWAAGALRFGARSRPWLVSAALAVYVLVTGSGPAVLRAAVMSLAAVWRPRSRTGGQGLGYLGVAGLLLLAADPLSAADPSFQLSFLASLGILIWPALLGRLGRGLAASFGAQICTIPVVLHRFYRFCPYGPVIGLALLPLGAALITFLFGAALAGMICPPAFAFLGPAIDLVLRGFLALVGTVGRLPGSLLTTGHPAPAVAGCALAVIVGAGLLPRRHGMALQSLPDGTARRAVFAAVCAVLLLCAHTVWRHRPPPEPVVCWFCVGQGDCALIQAGGRAVLVDFGPPGPPGSTGGDRFSRSVLPYLKATRCRPFLGVLSHPHADHVGGMRPAMVAFPEMVVVSRDVFREQVLQWAGPCPGDPPSRFVFLDCPARSGLDLATREEPASREGLMLEFFFAPETAGTAEDLNELSLVCRLATGTGPFPPAAGHSPGLVLFTGDLGEQGEFGLLQAGGQSLQSRVLKVGHHGSSGSSTAGFLDAVGAELAVISVGVNGFGHPSAAAVSRIAATGSAVFRTDRAGWIEARFAGQTILVRTFRPPGAMQGTGRYVRELGLGEGGR